MATFVLCRGAWVGGWQWKEVAALLRFTGHEVFTPTFTGLGEAYLEYKETVPFLIPKLRAYNA